MTRLTPPTSGENGAMSMLRALQKTINPDPYLTPYKKLNFKRMVDVRMTIKLLEENIGDSPPDFIF